MDASAALSGLLDVSTQVRTAVILDADGVPIASTLDDDASAERIAQAVMRMLEEADTLRPEGSAPVTQVEGATREGSVFVVREGELAIAATTGAEPMIGIVMYDLRTCLRALNGESAPAGRRRKAEKA